MKMSNKQSIAELFILLILCTAIPFCQYFTREIDCVFQYWICSGILLIFLFIKTLFNKGKSTNISQTDVLLFAFILYCLLRTIFCNTPCPATLPVKGITAILAYIFGKSHLKDIKNLVIACCIFCSIQCIIIFLQYFGILESLSFYFRTSGTFGNPAIPASILAMTIAMLFPDAKNKWITLAAIAVFLITLLICNSRAAVFAVLCSLLYSTTRKSGRKERIVLLASLIVALILLYFIRPISADTRLLIWRSSLNIFDDNPIFGLGAGSFRTKYMFAQAEYFSTHPDSRFILAANQHSSPYNILVLTLCEFGIVGTILFLFFILFVLKGHNNVASSGFISILALSMFLNTDSTYLLFFCFWVLAGVLSKRDEAKEINLYPFRYYIHCVAIVTYMLCCFYSYTQINSPAPNYNDICSEGDKYFEKKDFNSAEKMYTLAYNMIPCRIEATYKLFLLYCATNQEKAKETAEFISNQQLSITNGNTIRIKQDIKEKLSRMPLIHIKE